MSDNPEVDPGVTEAAEELAGVRVVLKPADCSERFGIVFSALGAAQLEFTAIEKSSTANAGKYKYDYAPLDAVLAAVRPILNRHGLAVSHSIQEARDSMRVATMIVHGESEQWVRCAMTLISTADPQARGSNLTYARRYTLLSLLGVMPGGEDDDAMAGKNHVQQTRHRSPSGTPSRNQSSPPASAASAPAEKREQQAKPPQEFVGGYEPPPGDPMQWSNFEKVMHLLFVNFRLNCFEEEVSAQAFAALGALDARLTRDVWNSGDDHPVYADLVEALKALRRENWTGEQLLSLPGGDSSSESHGNENPETEAVND